MPDGEQYNIWDVLPQELSDDVLSAIKHAFHLGMDAHRIMINNSEEAENVFCKYILNIFFTED